MTCSPKSENCDEEVQHHQVAEDLEVDANFAAEAAFDLLHGSVPDVAVLERLAVPPRGLLDEQHRDELTVLERGAVGAEVRFAVDAAQQSSSNHPFGRQRLRHRLDGVNPHLLRLEVRLHQVIILLDLLRDLLDLIRLAQQRSILGNG